jgi:hypothetical protein
METVECAIESGAKAGQEHSPVKVVVEDGTNTAIGA